MSASKFQPREQAVTTLLNEIRKNDVARKKMTSNNPETADILTRDIFRLFGIMDTVRIARYEAGEPIRMMDDIVAASKKEMKAMQSDLELLPVNYQTEKQDFPLGNPPSFPYFFCLPDAVKQRHIFRQVDDVNDKKTIIEVFPELAAGMGWKKNIFLLDATLPDILEKQLLNSTDLAEVCAAHALIHKTLFIKFKEKIGNGSDLFPFADIAIFEKFYSAEQSHSPLPLTLWFFVRDEAIESQKLLLKKLSQYGKSVLDCVLYVDSTATAMDNLTRIGNALKQMPNLRRVKVWGRIDRDLLNPINIKGTIEREIIEFSNVTMPPMNKLKSLYVCPSTNVDDALWHKIISTYGPMVRFFGDLGIWLHRSAETDTNLLISNAFGIEYNMMLREMRSLLNGAPLVSFEIIHANYRISEMLVVLASFGKTLKRIQFGGGRCVCQQQGVPNLTDDEEQDNSWMVDVHFPNVTQLFLGCPVKNWGLILLFPALESLTISEGPQYPDDYLSISHPFKLMWNRNVVKESTIWKMLPKLLTIELQKRVHGNGIGYIQSIKVLRKRNTQQ